MSPPMKITDLFQWHSEPLLDKESHGKVSNLLRGQSPSMKMYVSCPIKPLTAEELTSKYMRKKYRVYCKLFLPGVTLFTMGLLIYLCNPLKHFMDMFFTMNESSILSKLWTAPPAEIYLKVYVFNITNGERFIKGEDTNLKLKEVGPYVYKVGMEQRNISWHSNGTLSYSPFYSLTLDLDKSVGDPAKDLVTVPNLALLGLASKMHDAQRLVTVLLSTVVSWRDAQPVISLSVQDFLWGYDDKLISLGHKALPSWINFQKLGLFDRLLDEGENQVTMYTEKNKAFMVENVNGSPGLRHWGYKKDTDRGGCDMVNGTYDGTLFPRGVSGKLTIYRKMLCRPVSLEPLEDSTVAGLPVRQYTLSPSEFSRERGACYCANNQCSPPGLADISPCYFSVPVALSMPHFMGYDSSLYPRIEGIKPDPERHTTLIKIQPDVGVPMSVRLSLQANMVVRKTSLLRAKPFSQMNVPFLWASVEMDRLPGWAMALVWAGVRLCPLVQAGVALLLASVGLGLLLAASLRLVWPLGLGQAHAAILASIKTDRQTSFPLRSQPSAS